MSDNSQRAVVIDDSKSAVAQMLRLLDGLEDCMPIGFTDPREGLEWCRHNPFDLLITDYEMPHVNGIGVIAAIRASAARATVPIVMVTSASDRDVRYMALQTGATDFLAKPVDDVEFLARIRNLLDLQRANSALAEMSLSLTNEVRKASQVIQQSPAAVAITDPAFCLDYANDSFAALTGLDIQTFRGHSPLALLAGDHSAATDQAIRIAMAAGRSWRGILQIRHQSGALAWVSSTISCVRDKWGQITNHVFTLEDITLKREYEAQIERHAHFDLLTGLPNRALLQDRLGQALAAAQRNDTPMALLMINLHRFRSINDSFGHAAGDAALCEIAARLQSVTRQCDTLARVSGDEFALVLGDLREALGPEAVASRLCELIRAPIQVGDMEVLMSARIGISMFPGDGQTPQDLLRRATTAIPPDQSDLWFPEWRYFAPEMDRSARHRRKLESCLSHAIERAELSLAYQPIVDAASGRIVAAEALLRWKSEELGPVGPDQFIPIAEDNGMIVAIGNWVIETVCADLAAWRKQGLETVRIAINVSSRQLNDRALIGVISTALERHGLSADQLELELTERLLLNRSEETSRLLADLKAMGLRFAIDDFGTGYSAMAYLTSFPFDALKIDRSFISLVDQGDAALAQAIIAMAHSLGLEVVAEGVETAQQQEFLRRHQCEFAQGWLFARPQPAAQFAEMLPSYTFAAAP